MTVLKPLRELVSFKGGGTPSKQVPEYWDGDIPWASVKDFTSTTLSETQDFITQEGLRNSSANLIPKGHVIIPTRMSLGKAAINTVDLAINQDLRALVPRVPLDAKFLLHAVLSLKDEILKKGSGATVKGITQEELYKLEIPVPEEFDDQIRIAHLLGKVEGLIAQRKQHLQQLDDLLKSVFLEMFGDPVRNEKGWEKKAAIDYAECIVPGRDKPKSFSGATPWVTTGDLQHLGYTSKSRSEIGLSDDEIKEVRARVVPKSSVLLTCAGDLGVVSICTADMVINQQLHAFQVSEVMSEEFFMYSLSFHKKYMYQNASQTTLPYMNKTVCNRVPMIRPPKDLQDKFAKTVRFVHGIKARYQQSLTDLEALYGALSQQAFKGELDLSRVALPAAPIDGESPVAAAVPAPITAPLLELPETDLLLLALQDRTQLAPLLRFWLEGYRTQLGGVAFSLERFIAAAQTRLGELHPDNDFELRASDYEHVKAWVFDALDSGRLRQERNQVYCVIETKEIVLGNLIELKASQT